MQLSPSYSVYPRAQQIGLTHFHLLKEALLFVKKIGCNLDPVIAANYWKAGCYPGSQTSSPQMLQATLWSKHN